MLTHRNLASSPTCGTNCAVCCPHSLPLHAHFYLSKPHPSARPGSHAISSVNTFAALSERPAVLESISHSSVHVTGPGPSSLTASGFGSLETVFSLLHYGNCKPLEGRVWGRGERFRESSLNPFPTITLPVPFTSPQGNSKVGCERKTDETTFCKSQYKLRSSAPFLPIFFLDSCPTWL